VGKNLYKGKDSLKVQDYTFTALRKKVRIVAKPDKAEKTNTSENSDDVPKD
jgi:histidine ammonia-lyase